jgi:DNA-binding SARP family transcriptional activator/tetratricopeptide (TPR) repeat protein
LGVWPGGARWWRHRMLMVRVLGPLEVERDGGLLGVPRKQRVVLAALALDPNQVVSDLRLIECLWGDGEMPANPVGVLRTHVSMLGRLLGGRGGGELTLDRESGGYVLRVDPARLDAVAFERLAEEGEGASRAGDPERAVELWGAALGLWRGGHALPEVAAVSQTLREGPIRQLEERRLAVLAQRVEAELALGRHEALLGELPGLTAAYPAYERLRGLLMVALYRAGRPAEALGVFREGRQVLAEGFGLDPGPELQRLERQILANDPGLTLPALGMGGAGVLGSGVVVPAQLPPDVRDFTGRERVVARAVEWLGVHDSAAESTAVAMVVIAGAAGIGKTALAVHVAQRARGRFPDGQLFVDLRGRQAQPLEPGEVLSRFLRALGVDGQAIPEVLEERVGLYRARLAERRVLVVLDNAADEAQVRPLLPGSPSCGVLVTSRARLAGLEGAHPIELDMLPPDQAVELLGLVAGPSRVAAEPEAAALVVRHCGRLPLAVRIAGTRLAARPHWSVAQLAELLTDERRRLGVLQVRDLAVRASFELSYQGLGVRLRQVFRRLGLLDAPDFGCWVAAAAVDNPLAEAEELMEQLVEAQLLEIAGEDQTRIRYRFHGLLRLYARERAEHEEPPDVRRAVLQQMLGAWLALAERAEQRLPHGAPRVDRGDAPRWWPDQQTMEELLVDPLAWFDAERTALVAAVEQAASAGADEFAWELTGSLRNFFEVRCLLDEWWRTHQLALAASRRCGNRRGQAITLLGLGGGDFDFRLVNGEERLAYLEKALQLFGELGDRCGQASAQCELGFAYREVGRPKDALASLEQALQCFSKLGDRFGQASALHGLGVVHVDQGRLAAALASYERSLTLFGQAGKSYSQTMVLRRLGMLHNAQGRAGEAWGCLDQALALTQGLGDRRGEALVLQSRGELELRHGDQDAAAALLEQALLMLQGLGHRKGEATTLRHLGELHLAHGRLDKATGSLIRSLRILRERRIPLSLARTLCSLGTVHAAAGRAQPARAAWTEAHAIFQQLDAPEAQDVAARLEQLSSSEAS